MDRSSNRLTKIWVTVTLAGICAVLVLVWFRGQKPSVESAELAARRFGMRSLGLAILKQGNFKRCIVLGNPFVLKSNQSRFSKQIEKESYEGLKEGLGERIEVGEIQYLRLTDEAERDPSSVLLPPSATTPLSFMVRNEEWDRAMEGLDASVVVVTLIGIPADLKQQAWWNKETGPKLALVLPDYRVYGDEAEVGSLFTKKKIVASLEKSKPPLVLLGTRLLEMTDNSLQSGAGSDWRIRIAD